LIGVVVLTIGGLGIGFLLVLGAMIGSVLDQSSSGCDTQMAGAVLPAGEAEAGGLTSAQLANAGAVIAEGRRRDLPARAVIIALAVASQESGFKNYANNGAGGDLSIDQLGIEQSLQLPHEAVGTDHGSIGIFQQQWPWWGTMRELMDPAVSAGKFYDALEKIPGWESMPVTVAAQTVQRSAHPSAYADDEGVATRLVAQAGAGSTSGVAAPAAAPAAATVADKSAGFGPEATLAAAAVRTHFGFEGVIGGHRPEAGSKHSEGLAIDVMTTDKALGDRIAAFFIANREKYHVDNVIWLQRITNAGRGWRLPGDLMEDRGTRTENHYDHVHVDFLGKPTTGTERIGVDLIAPGAATAECVPTEQTVTTNSDVVYPVDKTTDRANYGNRGGHWARGHTGTDFSVPCGTPVLAATSGQVIIRTDQSWSGRWLVQVSTGIGQLTTWYGHMQAVSVSGGDTVAAGQQIGEVGSEGNSTGCHLHFEVHPEGGSVYQDSVDPTSWLRENVGRRSNTDPGGVVAADWASDPEAFTIATFNVLGDSHTSPGGKRSWMASGRARMPGVVRLLEKYGVDVVGLQEFQRPQYRAFRSHAGRTYDVWSPKEDTENAIAWRRERWSLVSSGAASIPYFDGHRRRMPVLRMRDRATGRESVFVNVHNPADTRRYPRQGRWRDNAVAREAALVRQLTASTGLPVFLTGDMNDRRKVFCQLAAGASMTASNGGSNGPSCNPPQRAGIDWILAAGGADFSDHTVDNTRAVKTISDHPFVVARARTR
jgi:endonuclease/exonuclease/phosphatase family metal-dependent hydrolase